MVTNTVLIATKYKSVIYPSTPVIYHLIQKLKKYISLNKCGRNKRSYVKY